MRSAAEDYGARQAGVRVPAPPLARWAIDLLFSQFPHL